ncbi:MAG: hypothetical protein DWQ07_06705 [Chloroflexi bacterium]|nr:MAG: hypothetical protein DWQ07_06705 [Chloroflexota bacterium]MBL1195610.1 hypothetical protein [Chloroflexota bacterium]NOH12897.1 hypothetical protein [Chloroflexota bacterium]
MRKKTLFLFLILGLLLGMSVTPAFAAKPLDVHIEVYKPIGVNHVPFTATGDAVDKGLVCAFGTEEDLSVDVVNTNRRFTTLKILKRFTCGDGSGTFNIRMTVKLFADSHTTANWRVVAGTGDYTRLKGHGKLYGTPIVPEVSIFDVYDGKMK